MKIIYLNQYFNFKDEPGSIRSFGLASGFVKLGHKVEILTSTSNKSYQTRNRWTIVEKNGLKIYYLYLPYNNSMTYFQRTIVFTKFFLFCTFKLLSLKGDLVLASSTPITIGIPALINKWIKKTPFIFETRDIWPEAVIAIGAVKNKILQKVLYLLENTIYKNSAALVPLSVDMKNSIIRRYPNIIQKPIKVIENISDIEDFKNNYNKKISIIKKKIGYKPRFSILYAGTFGRVNGVKYVIELAHKLAQFDPTIIFILIGNGIEKKKIINFAIKKKVLNKNVFFFNSVSRKDLPQLYHEVDMGSSFVINIKALWVNSAQKFFDTMAAGKPILINYKGWQKRIILKKNLGYILPINLNNYEIKKFLLYTKQKKKLIKQRQNAQRVARKKYDINVAILKYNALINEVFKNYNK